MDRGSYLRITGWLREDGAFTLDQGWETPRITQSIDGCKDHRLELLDSAGNVLDSISPQVDFDDCQSSGGRMKSKQVVGYLPWHAGGAAVRLTKHGRILYSRALGTPPIVRWKSARIEGEQLVLRWSVTHREPVTFNVAIIRGPGEAVPIVYKTTETSASIPIASIPFGGPSRAVVLATDGIRSNQDRSDEFVLPEKPPRVVILQPTPGQVFSEAEGLSLSGFATDPLGRSLPDEPLLWRLDGREIVRGSRLHWVNPLPAGSHVIDLTWDREQLASERVAITVRPRTDAEERWENDVRRAQAEMESARPDAK
jgi:hypothetical protein